MVLFPSWQLENFKVFLSFIQIAFLGFEAVEKKKNGNKGKTSSSPLLLIPLITNGVPFYETTTLMAYFTQILYLLNFPGKYNFHFKR